jgi:flavodoxin-like protein
MKVLTVFAHPGSGSLCHGVLERFDAGLRDAGHTNEIVDLYAIGFDPVLRERDSEVKAANALAFIAPMYFVGFPAMLNGWIERAFSPGFAFALEPKGWKGDLPGGIGNGGNLSPSAHRRAEQPSNRRGHEHRQHAPDGHSCGADEDRRAANPRGHGAERHETDHRYDRNH